MSLYKNSLQPKKAPKSLVLAILFVSIISCNKLVDVGPPSNTINKENVYSTDITAINVINGIYASMSASSLGDGSSISSFMQVFPSLSADELKPIKDANTGYFQYYQNNLSNQSNNIWPKIYSFIYTANVALEGLNESKELTPGIKRELIGEAKFIRAFHYFYLVNLYGDAPLLLTPDYLVNASMSRTNKDVVLSQVENDLISADSLLSDTYRTPDLSSTTNERTTPISWAAKSMLSRTYLYMKKFSEAEKEASLVIQQSQLFSLEPLSNVFLMNNSEAIWQLQPVNQGWNTEEARFFVLPSSGPGRSWPLYLSNYLLNSFEDGDKRKEEWVDSVITSTATYYFPYKYKSAKLNDPITEYSVVLRLSEQYLIRAEARTELGNYQGAVDDLNKIRNRAGLSNYQGAIERNAILTAILHERQVEFFTEWGHRWLDLKRLETINSVMNIVTAEKGGSWQPYKQLYPIPLVELRNAPNLVQNDGY